MRGGRTQQIVNTSNKTDAVERAKAEHKENCELRLAKIQNSGKAANTPWPDADQLGKPQPEIGK